MNIDWFKILLLLIVGLLVVGPEKLPSYARKAARLLRNVQRLTTNFTAEVSKAINLDDEEENRAVGFKKDLISIKKSLEDDVAELKATLDSQSRAISETVESGTKDAATQIAENAREISAALDTQAREIKAAVNESASTVARTVEARVKDGTVNLNQAAKEVSAAVEGGIIDTAGPGKDEPQVQPVSAPPIIPASQSEEPV